MKELISCFSVKMMSNRSFIAYMELCLNKNGNRNKEERFEEETGAVQSVYVWVCFFCCLKVMSLYHSIEPFNALNTHQEALSYHATSKGFMQIVPV